MTSFELWVHLTGVAALLSSVPWLRVLRARMELSRARVFLRWRSYTRTLRLGGLALAAFLAFVAVSVALEPEEQTLQVFMPVGLLIFLLQIGVIYMGWMLYDIARGPRERGAGSGGLLLLSPGLGAKAALLATGLPAIVIILRLVLFVDYHSEAVKARFFLHFSRAHRAHQLFVVLAAVAIAANLAYTAWNPSYLQERGLLLPTGLGVLFFHIGFIGFAAFITWAMSGASWPRKRS